MDADAPAPTGASLQREIRAVQAELVARIELLEGLVQAAGGHPVVLDLIRSRLPKGNPRSLLDRLLDT